jgi:hypothetical protein
MLSGVAPVTTSLSVNCYETGRQLRRAASPQVGTLATGASARARAPHAGRSSARDGCAQAGPHLDGAAAVRGHPCQRVVGRPAVRGRHLRARGHRCQHNQHRAGRSERVRATRRRQRRLASAARHAGRHCTLRGAPTTGRGCAHTQRLRAARRARERRARAAVRKAAACSPTQCAHARPLQPSAGTRLAVGLRFPRHHTPAGASQRRSGDAGVAARRAACVCVTFGQPAANSWRCTAVGAAASVGTALTRQVSAQLTQC